MEDFIAYLTQQLEAGKSDIARLEADGRHRAEAGGEGNEPERKAGEQ